MANFESGVKSYIVGECTITVNFPVDFKDNHDVSCRQCPYLASNERICQLNKQVVQYPHKYVGDACPLVFKESE